MEEEPPQKKPTRLAIGVEGGFDAGVVEKAEFEDHTSIVILPEYQTIPLPSPALPQKVGSTGAAVDSGSSVCVCACVRACVCVCMCVYARVRVCVSETSNRSLADEIRYMQCVMCVKHCLFPVCAPNPSSSRTLLLGY